MKIRPLESTVRLSLLPWLLASGFVLGGCDDERLRELGYTLDALGNQQDEGSDEAPPQCVPDPIDADIVQREIANDLATTPLESRPFLRYFSLADQIARGLCYDDLRRSREAISKLANGLSREPAIVVPHAFGPEGGLLRIDLRDYGWTHPIEANGRTSPDAWQAVSDNSGFSLELTGEQASFIAAQTHTQTPVLGGLAFVAAAVEPALYYAILGVPPTLGELRQSVGLSSELDPVAHGSTRTVQQYSRIVRLAGSLRVIDRYAIQSGTAGTYYEATMVDAGTFFADPLHVQPAAQRLILFSLPNDLIGFAITDAQGVRQGIGEAVLDTNREDSKASVPTSCGNCHALGTIPAVNVARSAILGHPDQFDPEVVAAYRSSLDDTQSAAQFEADSAPYRGAVERSTGETFGGDPISGLSFESDTEVDLARAAGELLVSPDVLLERLPDLAPELRPLGLELGLSRAKFSASYAGAYCVLHAGDDNPPAASFCGQEP